MENRAYAFAFMGVLGIICLGAYVAVSALTDTNGDPLIRFNETSSAPTAVALATGLAGTRSPTPTITPFIALIPTIIFPTATPTAGPLTPTATETLQPFPSARLLPTRTPTPSETPTTTPPSNTKTPAPPLPAATNTPVPPPPPPSNFAYRVESGPSVNRSRNCVGQYYIYGIVRDAQGQTMSGVRIRYATGTVFPPDAITEAKGYELTVGTADTEWFIRIVDGGGNPLSPTVTVRTSGIYNNSDCWFQLNWRSN